MFADALRVANLRDRRRLRRVFPDDAKIPVFGFSLGMLHWVKCPDPVQGHAPGILFSIELAQALGGVQILLYPGEERKTDAGEENERDQCFEQSESPMQIPKTRGFGAELHNLDR